MAHIIRSALTVLCLPSLVNSQAIQACPAAPEPTTSSERTPPPQDVQAVTDIVSTSGIAGFTTYRLSLGLSGSTHNAYTIAGSAYNPMYVPPARQVAAPFGADTGGTNPAYFAYNAECQYDSWLTVGMTNGGSGLGNIGIAFDDWTLTRGVSVTDGAVFWMNPNDSPGRATATDPMYKSVIAQITVRSSDTAWRFVVGEAQGRSIGYEAVPRVVDWRVNCISFDANSQPGAPAPAPPSDNKNPTAPDDGVCPLAGGNYQDILGSVNSMCCNGGHRRSLQTGGGCTLTTCSSGCSAAFDPIYRNCQADPTFGPLLQSIPNLQGFVTACGLGR